MIPPRKIYRWLAFILCLAVCTGCWDHKEMDDLALVMASGLDLAEDGQLEASVQIALPTAIPSQSGGTGQKPVLTLSAKGRSGHEVISKLQMQLSRKLTFGHRGVIVLGENYARHGIDQVLDAFIRFPGARYNSYVVTTYGTTAKEILNTPYMLEHIPTVGIKHIQLNGFSQGAKIDEFLSDVAASGKAPITAGITVLNKGTDQETFILDKAAIFRRNQLVGFLSRQEVNLFRMWTRDTEGLELTAQIEPEDDQFKGTVTLGTLNVRADVRTSMKNQVPEVTLTYKVSARVVENNTKLDMSKQNIIHQVETKFSNSYESMLRSMIRRSQEKYKADIFGLGNEVHIQHPYAWKTIKDQWLDIYPQIPVSVQFDMNIDRIGRTQAPAHTKK